MHESGRDVKKDLSEAVERYEKAAVKGDVDAQFELGLIYYQGNGVAKDLSKAADCFKKLAE